MRKDFGNGENLRKGQEDKIKSPATLREEIFFGNSTPKEENSKKARFLIFLEFLSRKREGTAYLIFYFSTQYRLGYLEKKIKPILSVGKKFVTSFCKDF